MSRSPKSFSLVSLSIVLVLAGCGQSPEPPAQQTPAPAAAAPDTRAHMADHFSRVREVEDAIIRGDLEAARAPALWIADHQESAGLPAHTESKVTEMKSAAKSVASTDDIGNAAIAAATLVGTCGSCHAAAKVTPKIPAVAADASGPERVRHMLEHQHAIERMYRGLISPTSDEWRTGALALKAAPLGGKALADVSKEAVAAEARVHELADRAVGAAEKSARVAIYGSIIGACASCHGLHGRIWGPGLPKAE
jgi:mono/diheme cytochrome c family protein